MEDYKHLEIEFGKFGGYTKEQMVCCSSGTASLHLALEALKLPLGSEVILSDFNMIACARAVTLAGLKPVFVDCNKKLLIDPILVSDYLEYNKDNFNTAYIVSKVSAILCTHIYGRSCDMQSIHDIAGKYDIRVIEDLAEAHGIPPHPNTDAACWSFYKNKIIAGEEGGAVGFEDEKCAMLARSLRSLGFTDGHDYTHIPRGHNYRLANCLAKKIVESLHNYKQNLQMRRITEQSYNNYCPDAWRMPERDVPWVHDLRIPGLTTSRQGAIVEALRSKRIEARLSFKPMSTQTEYERLGGVGIEAESASREIVYLPLLDQYGYDFSDSQCKRTFDIITKLV